MLDDKQYADLLDNTLLPMLETATGGDRAIVSVLVGILSELRTSRAAHIELLKKFNHVTANGSSMLVEQA